ncbi:transmembrane protein 74 [Paroedura picta]|uniref:transmembrane protein 74 n=1 Tax=Paroedura picta TaxID=143630 RepID=UPI004055BCA4
MALLELLHLGKGGDQSDRCHDGDGHLHALPCQRQAEEGEERARAFAMAAECSMGCGKAAGKMAAAEAGRGPVSSTSPSPLFREHTSTANDTIAYPSPSREGQEAARKRACCCESETSFARVDENVNHLEPERSLVGKSPDQDLLPCPDPCGEAPPEWPYDPPSLVSEEEDDAGSVAAGGKSVDYGFISAILFLVSGILLVIISYVVPRDVTVDPGTVAAREMERLEKESAEIGAHLDRCVIAGLCLLTLGGVVLSSLLMMSMWKGELYQRSRLASSRESAKLYGSFNFRMKSSTNDNMELSLVEEDSLAVDS